MTKRRVKKMKKSRNQVLYLLTGLVIAIFIFTAGTMAMMVKDEIVEEPEQPPEKVEEPHLYVEDVYFIKLGSRADTDIENFDIVTTVYITNDGLADAKNVKITAYPIDEDKNLALDKCDKMVGNIPAQETSEIEFTINVPSGERHNVDLLIFEKNKLILRGSGSVVIQGTYKNTPKFQTDEIRGTSNDSDYDGMNDEWERYYGLDPSNSKDAYTDADGDGVNNLQEYRAGTSPGKPADKKTNDNGDGGEDETNMANAFSSGDSSTSFLWLMIVIIVIIIIIIIILKVTKPSEQQNSYNSLGNTQQTRSGIHQPTNSYHNLYGQDPNVPKRCLKCGGWVVNDVCITCGGRYPSNSNNNNSMKKVEDSSKDNPFIIEEN